MRACACVCVCVRVHVCEIVWQVCHDMIQGLPAAKCSVSVL